MSSSFATTPSQQPTTTTTTPQSKPASKKPLVIIISGPTGVGKSAVASRLCHPSSATRLSHRSGHIISADSVQVYRGVQIGANKPSAEERRRITHHLIDVVSGDEVGVYSAGEWMRDALGVIERLAGRRRRDEEGDGDSSPERKRQRQRRQCESLASQSILPIVVGGTMMYIQWLIHGQPDAGKSSPEAIAKATAFVDRFDPSSDWFAAIDDDIVTSLPPPYSHRISSLGRNDWYRLRRTLEVAYSSPSSSNEETPFSGDRDGGLLSLSHLYDVRCFFLCPTDRLAHNVILDDRCEDMLLEGLVKETCDLYLEGMLPSEGQLSRAIGYRQVLDYLTRDVEFVEGDEERFMTFISDFTTATRRYAKKQMQWFRKESEFVFVPVQLTNDDCSCDDDDDDDKRIRDVANRVIQMCLLDRNEYERTCLSTKYTNSDGETCDSESAMTRRRNEEQGKGMKFFVPKRSKITKGSEELRRLMKEADECTARMRGKKSSLDDL